MSEPIDLDLVELRCKLRGWPCRRRAWPGKRLRPDIVVMSPGGEINFFSSGGLSHHHSISASDFVHILTAPRWTLDRLLSEPPKGWISRPDWFSDCGEKYLTWGGESRWYDGAMRDHEVLCRFGTIPERTPRHRLSLGIQVNPYMTATGMDGVIRLAERHKAAAELALILAEVEP